MDLSLVVFDERDSLSRPFILCVLVLVDRGLETNDERPRSTPSDAPQTRICVTLEVATGVGGGLNEKVVRGGGVCVRVCVHNQEVFERELERDEAKIETGGVKIWKRLKTTVVGMEEGRWRGVEVDVGKRESRESERR